MTASLETMRRQQESLRKVVDRAAESIRSAEDAAAELEERESRRSGR